MNEDVIHALRLALGREFLESVPVSYLSLFLSGIRRRRFRRGEVIFQENDIPGDVYVVSSGHVKHRLVSSSGGEFIHHLSPPGDFFANWTRERSSGGAVALTDCELLVIERESFLDFLNHVTSVPAFFLHRLGQRDHQRLETIQSLAFQSVPERLASMLVRLAVYDGETLRVPLYLNQSELARLIGATRETVNHWLRFFAQKGWVSVEGREIRVLDRDALLGFVS